MRPPATHRTMLHLVIVILTLTVIALRPNTARADTTSCQLDGSDPTCPYYAPPTLLNLNQPLYAATDAQRQSLQTLESQAVANAITDHGLTDAETNAVQSWGRNDAEAELFALIVEAIKTTATARTADQQNVVDWLSAVEQRQAEGAAQSAGLEYVKWSGLSQLGYQQLLATNPSQSALHTFLCGGDCSNWQTSVEPYNNTNTSQADGGYCVYRAPAPYGSDYTGYNDPTCFAPCSSVLGCLPPTPTYDQFVEWGEADQTNATLSSSQYALVSGSIAAGMIFGGVALGAGVAGASLTTGLASTFVGTSVAEAIFPYAAVVGEDVAAELGAEIAAGELAAGAGAIVGALIFAITTAVIEGITIANAVELPDKLATLIYNANTTAPDPAALLNDTNGSANLFSLFVGATLPVPRNASCDNSLIPADLYGAGYTWISPTGQLINTVPCLNPTRIPPATGTDSQFLVQAKDSSDRAVTPTITLTDAQHNTTMTTRLSGNWFINQVNGSSTQTLGIPYTDWDGNEQVAWLLGNPTDGYRFVGYSATAGTSKSLNPSTCLSDGTCWSSDSIHYVGSDGKDYSASVQGYKAPTGSPTSSTAVEGSPVTFDANKYAPGNATGIITYQWRFQLAGCGMPCTTFDPSTFTAGPAYTAAVSGDQAAYTWQTSGSYQVQLTATDADGNQAVDTFPVSVADVPPVLQLDAVSFTGEEGTTFHLSGTIQHAGTLDNEVARVNWGDGSEESANGGPNSFNLAGNPLTLTVLDANHFTLSDSHTYAAPGTYHGTVQVHDNGGGTDSETFTVDVTRHPTGTQMTVDSSPSVYGQPVTFTAIVTSAQMFDPPSGKVSFYDDGTTLLGTRDLSVNGFGSDQATFSTSDLSVGSSHSITAVYEGDSDFQPSTSSAVSQRVDKAGTGTTLTTTPNPSVWGQSVTFTATLSVTTPGAGKPGGTVEFKDGAGDISGCAAQPVSTAAETATCTTSALSVAGHNVTASYGGDSNFTASTSSSQTQTVQKADTGSSLSSSRIPVTVGQSVTFTAPVSVKSPGAGTPTGIVTFYDGTASVGTGTLGTSGAANRATFSTSLLAVGAHSIKARYGGDSHFNGSESAVITQYVDTNLSRYPKTTSGAYNLSNANLSGAYLGDANLTNADLRGANLTGANFTIATLSGANLSNGNFKGATFSGANLTGANLTGANLMGAKGMSTANLTNVTWSGTLCPDGTSSDKDGETCVGHL